MPWLHNLANFAANGSRKSKDISGAEESLAQQRRRYWRLVTGEASSAFPKKKVCQMVAPESLLASGLALTTYFCTPAELAASPSYAGLSALRRIIPRALWLEAQGLSRCARRNRTMP